MNSTSIVPTIDQITSGIIETLERKLDAHAIRPAKSKIYVISGIRINVRCKRYPEGNQKYRFRFDVTTSFLESGVDFFIFGCGASEHAYVFPRNELNSLLQGWQPKGQGNKPNFNIQSDVDQFENQDTHRQYNIARYDQAYEQIVTMAKARERTAK